MIAKSVLSLYFLIVALGCSFLAKGQSTDSLVALLDQPLSQENRADILFQLTNHFRYNQPDSSILYGIQYIKFIGSSNLLKSAEIWRMIGTAQYVKGSFDEALYSFQEMKTIFDSLKVEEKLGSAYNNIGLIYAAQKDHDLAIDNYRKAISLHRQYLDVYQLSKNFSNLGISYMDLNLLDSAAFYFSESLKMAILSQNNEVITKAFNLKGTIFEKLALVDSSLFHYQKALEVASRDNLWEIGYAKSGLAEAYLHKQELQKSLVYAHESLNIALKLNAKWELQRIYEILSKIYEANGQFKESLWAFKGFKQYADSIYNDEKNKEYFRLQLIEKEIENERLTLKNLKQEQEINVKNITIISGIILIVGALLILFLTIRLYRQRIKFSNELLLKSKLIEQQNKELVSVNQTKNKMFSILSHDLVGPLGTLKGMLNMLVEGSISQQEFSELAVRMKDAVSNTTFTLINLLQWARVQMLGKSSNIRNIDMAEVVNEAIGLLHATADKSNIVISSELIEPVRVFADQNEMRLVIRNLLSNAIKYTPKDGNIFIKSKDDESLVTIIIEDTGLGISPEKVSNLFNYENRSSEKGLHGESGTGLGLILCQETIIANGGTIEVNSKLGKGTSVYIRLPKSK